MYKTTVFDAPNLAPENSDLGGLFHARNKQVFDAQANL